MAKKYWLVKSEPDCFSIQHLAAAPKQTTAWSGVRNYQARNFMRDDMKVGDGVLFYHSSADPPAVAGTAVIARAAYPDHTAWAKGDDHFDPKASPANPIWQMVDIKLDSIFPTPVPIGVLRTCPALRSMELLRRGSRLSVQPVTPAEFKAVLQLAAAAKPKNAREPRCADRALRDEACAHQSARLDRRRAGRTRSRPPATLAGLARRAAVRRRRVRRPAAFELRLERLPGPGRRRAARGRSGAGGHRQRMRRGSQSAGDRPRRCAPPARSAAGRVRTDRSGTGVFLGLCGQHGRHFGAGRTGRRDLLGPEQPREHDRRLPPVVRQREHLSTRRRGSPGHAARRRRPVSPAADCQRKPVQHEWRPGTAAGTGGAGRAARCDAADRRSACHGRIWTSWSRTCRATGRRVANSRCASAR